MKYTILTGNVEDAVTELFRRANTGMAVFGDPNNSKYTDDCTLYHEPTKTKIVFVREVLGPIACWHLSMSFRGACESSPMIDFDEVLAKLWLDRLFGPNSSKLINIAGFSSPKIRHYLLNVELPFKERPY